jgi:hypothetical protein
MCGIVEPKNGALEDAMERAYGVPPGAEPVEKKCLSDKLLDLADEAYDLEQSDGWYVRRLQELANEHKKETDTLKREVKSLNRELQAARTQFEQAKSDAIGGRIICVTLVFLLIGFACLTKFYLMR